MRRPLLPMMIVAGALAAQPALAAEVVVKAVKGTVAKPDPDAAYWSQATPIEVSLMGQPMVTPRPATTTTTTLSVQAVHDGTWAAFRFKWKDTEASYAGKPAEYSDAVAMQFPARPGDTPPSVFMGAKDAPVHILHWRAQYERDAKQGKPTVKQLYPNATADMYPMEFADHGSLGKFKESDVDTFSPARAAGNPQAYAKTGVDEILAEGFGTSAVQEGRGSLAASRWANGEWTVVVVRKLDSKGASVLTAGKPSFIAFAVWQGGQGEIGSRKSITMQWTPVVVEPARIEEARR